MVQTITDQKLRAELSYEVQQRIQWSLDMLRLLKDAKDGLMPDGGNDPANSRVSRVRETLWSLYEDLARSTVQVLLDCNQDARGLVAVLTGNPPKELPAPGWTDHTS